MSKSNFITLNFTEYPETEMLKRAAEFNILMQNRRTVREFSSRPVNINIIKECIKTAGSAPSGANMQPWYFAVISDPKVKKKIRLAAEQEEREFYENRAPEEWLNALKPFDTDANKPFLETAPHLIAIFEQKNHTENGEIIKHYYVKESVGLASGLLITALHNAGLAVLTHTPSPMNFLNDILQRPDNDKPFLLLVVGYPEENVKVPNIKRKELKEIAAFY
ncbi:MAG: nitroreductase family protein [Melioribacteraceae bacterium]|nr:nitroreductase family protein [Melioribacteraceae bacterium]MCF8354424.1 nitroreductase family protein [Melioribacteraceae bacterium]MCF8394034.1 nitroreductase family protein [Melioribacteraceae bacterium]MCF8419800.1 nitroreductase family protein [Melioribacteraceae bacterium]